ncbi:MAG: Bacterial Ig-like domain (group 2) [Gemmatimonadetes bacterium]|nr:Bacterial Ig-like domain (group 2) [Gemmatimonadota bacterium]
MRSAVLLAVFTALSLSAGGCTGYLIGPGDPGTVAVEGVKVTPQVIQFSKVGETRQLVATVAPTNATDQAVTWESTDATVASVSATGLVTAQAAGTGIFVTVITHDGHHEASVNVSVIIP